MPKETTKTMKETSPINIGNIVAIIVLIAIISLGGLYLAKYNTKKTPKTVAAAQTINYDCNEGQTALDVLKTKGDVQTQDSELGVFVNEINGTKNDNGSFWIYYVNGEMGQVGAEQYQCQNGDKIEWRFEKLL